MVTAHDKRLEQIKELVDKVNRATITRAAATKAVIEEGEEE